MNESLQSWWQQLAPRERGLIAWGGAGLMLALGYAYLWLPLDAERHKLRAALPSLRASAAQMQVQADEVLRLKALAVAPVSGAALQSALQQAAQDTGQGAKAPQFGMLDERRVSAAWPAISFDAWSVLVAKLQNSQRIRLESVAVEALPEPGMVRVQAVFASGA